MASAKYTKKDLRMMTMFYINFFFQAQAICSKSVGQQEESKNRKDHFDTVGATGIKRISFAALFLCNMITFCYHKRICQN